MTGKGKNTPKNELIQQKIKEVENFFADPKNIEIVEKNKEYSKKISKYIEDSQNNLISELERDVAKDPTNIEFNI